jgi:DNA polymerase theta
MGIARKIKNGARRVALDRAEEARAAAFSAYEALGVQVPAALALPIVGTLDEEEGQLAPAITFDSTMEALSVGAELKTTEVPAGAESKIQLAIGEESDTLLQKLESIPSFRDHKPTSSVPAADESISRETADNVDPDMAPHVPTLENSTSLQPVAEACEEVQMLKCKDGGSAKGALFTGSLIAQQEFAVDDPVESHLMLPTRGPLDVDKLAGGFDEFLTKWQGVDEFTFDFYFKNQSNGVPELFEMMGVAVCWKDSPVYYINFSTAHMSSQQHATSKTFGDEKIVTRDTETALNESQARWRTVGTMLSKTGVRKIAWDLKVQLQALSNPGLHVPSTRQVTETERSLHDAKAKDGQIVALPSLKLQGPFIDIRVAAWLLWPDEESARPLSLEQVRAHLFLFSCTRLIYQK